MEGGDVTNAIVEEGNHAVGVHGLASILSLNEMLGESKRVYTNLQTQNP